MSNKRRNKKTVRKKTGTVERVKSNDNNIQSVEASWSGPLPPPNILMQYDELQTGAADRIIQMAEKESAHRHKMEQAALNGDISLRAREFDERRLGQIFGFIISIVAIGGGIVMAIQGVTGWGAILSLSGVAALAGIFVLGRSNKDKKK